jgi:hypothetical protein
VVVICSWWSFVRGGHLFVVVIDAETVCADPAEPGRIVAAEPRGLHRLYVVLTRAVSALHIIHAEPLPAALQTPSAHGLRQSRP